MVKLYNYLYLFLLLYQPPIIKYNILHFLSVIAWIYILKDNKYLLDKRLYHDMVFFFFINIYLAIIIMFNNSNYNFIYSKLIIMLEIIPCSFYISKNIKINEVFNYLKYITIFQGIISIFIFLFPPIKALQFLVYYNLGYNEQYMENLTFRLNGFSTFLYYTTPIFQAIFSGYVFLYEKNIIKKILYFLILISSGIINARISIVILFISITVFSKRKIKLRDYIIIFISTIVIVIIITNINLEKINKQTYLWIKSGVNEIIQFLKGENIGYFNALEKYNKMKPLNKINIWQIIFGAGKYIIGAKGDIYSDIGYYNDIYLGGMFYSIMIWVYFIYKLARINTNCKYNNIAMVLLIIMIVGNIKGIIIDNNEIITIIYILYYSCVVRVNFPSSAEV